MDMARKTVRTDVVAGVVAGVIGLVWIGAILTSLVLPPPIVTGGGGILTGDQIALREHEWGFNQFTKGGPEICAVTGHTVTITLTNDGKNLHGFQIVDSQGKQIGGLNKSDLLSPGQVRQVTFKIPPGDYFYICPVSGHRAKGMVGPCVVQAGCSAA